VPILRQQHSTPSIPNDPEELESCNARPAKIQETIHFSGQGELNWNFEVQILLASLDTYESPSSTPAEMDWFNNSLENVNDTNQNSSTLTNASCLRFSQAVQIVPPPQPFVLRANHDLRNSRMSLPIEEIPHSNYSRTIYKRAIGLEAHL
jgi:hypothetical protein